MRITIKMMREANWAYKHGRLRDACEGYYHAVPRCIALNWSDAKQKVLQYRHNTTYDYLRAMRYEIIDMIKGGNK